MKTLALSFLMTLSFSTFAADEFFCQVTMDNGHGVQSELLSKGFLHLGERFRIGAENNLASFTITQDEYGIRAKLESPVYNVKGIKSDDLHIDPSYDGFRLSASTTDLNDDLRTITLTCLPR